MLMLDWSSWLHLVLISRGKQLLWIYFPVVSIREQFFLENVTDQMIVPVAYQPHLWRGKVIWRGKCRNMKALWRYKQLLTWLLFWKEKLLARIFLLLFSRTDSFWQSQHLLPIVNCSREGDELPFWTTAVFLMKCLWGESSRIWTCDDEGPEIYFQISYVHLVGVSARDGVSIYLLLVGGRAHGFGRCYQSSLGR